MGAQEAISVPCWIWTGPRIDSGSPFSSPKFDAPKKGDILKESKNFSILRPGKQKRGAEARTLNEIEGKLAIHEIKMGEGILLEDCSD